MNILTSVPTDTTCLYCNKRFKFGQKIVVVLDTTITATTNFGARVGADADYTNEEFIHEQCFEDMRNALGITRKAALLTGLRTRYGIASEYITSYIDEAEHQDGYTYWLQFQTVEELRTDMHLYYKDTDG